MSKADIDVVLTWVDGNDPVWLSEKAKYDGTINSLTASTDSTSSLDQTAGGAVRFRDWDNLRYIFRGIEKFMSWVRTVHFVTWGHLPTWLNTDAEKLHIVKHSDFIPEQYLPTFNSSAIEVNIFRIPGLAEQYINFNDDMFVIGETKAEDFFKDGKPRDSAVISPPPCFRDIICNVEINNFGIINDYFMVEDTKKNRSLWYTPIYGSKLLRTMLFSRFHTILGLFEPHIPYSYLKSTAQEVWEKEEAVLDQTSRNKFRTRDDVSEWLFRHWQIMTGNFVPRSLSFGKLFDLSDNNKEALMTFREPGKQKVICLNDTIHVKDFERVKKEINEALDKLLPEKSGFER